MRVILVNKTIPAQANTAITDMRSAHDITFRNR